MGPTILAIESSCDETSASVICNGKVLNNIIASQSVHFNYGGVVPELASRAHQRYIVNVVSQSLDDARKSLTDLDAVAFTRGPGLMGSLLVGSSFAKAMALALNIPLIAVNHMHAHVLSNFIEEPVPVFPFLCLTVSGGHTEIVLARDFLDAVVIGQTRDDAAGEAFDKAAKMMGLDYPGGPLIDRYAQTGNPTAFTFPDTIMPGLDFSFSGIKTAFLYFLRDNKEIDHDFVQKNLPDICASLQHHLVGMLVDKLIKAGKETGIKSVAIAGGVSANSALRKALLATAMEQNWKTFIPDFQYCTDNAAMIAMAAHHLYLAKEFSGMDVTPEPGLGTGH